MKDREIKKENADNASSAELVLALETAAALAPEAASPPLTVQTEGGVWLGSFPAPIVRLIGGRISNTDLMNIRLACRFFQSNTRAEFMRRVLANALLLTPCYYMHTKLPFQKAEFFEKLIAQMPRIKPFVISIIKEEPLAFWVLYALLDLPVLVREELKEKIGSARTRRKAKVYHFYALVGHEETFIAHMSEFHPGFKYDPADLDAKMVANNALMGGHSSFYNMLVARYGFPKLSENDQAALELLPSVVVSGELDNVAYINQTVAGGEIVDLEYMLQALRPGSKDPELLREQLETTLPPLLDSARKGKLSSCRKLIEQEKEDPKILTHDNETSLHFAAESGNYSCFRWLYDRDFSKENLPLTVKGASPIHFAARLGWYWFLRQAFLDFGVEIFKKTTLAGETVLHYAFRSGNIDLIDFLVDRCGLSLEDQDGGRNIPLHHYFLEEKPVEEQIDFVTRFVSKYNPKLFLNENSYVESPFDMMPAQCEKMIENLIGPLSENEL